MKNVTELILYIIKLNKTYYFFKGNRLEEMGYNNRSIRNWYY